MKRRLEATRASRIAEETLSIKVGTFYARGVVRSPGPVVLRQHNHWGEVGVVLTAHEYGVDCVYRRLFSSGEVEEREYQIGLSWTGANLGGRRPWLHCVQPWCRKRVARLFLTDPFFFCRACAGVLYASQLRQRSPRERRLSRIGEIRSDLGGDEEHGAPVPERPKGIHMRTYERKLAELAALEAEEWAWIEQAVKNGQISPLDVLKRTLEISLRHDAS